MWKFFAALVFTSVLGSPCVATSVGANDSDILLFTRTEAFRHPDLGSPLTSGLDPALQSNNNIQREMLSLARRNGWRMHYTEDPSQISGLGRYRIVIFYSTSGDILDRGEEASLKSFVRNGGNVIIVHDAITSLRKSSYFRGLIGTDVYGHGVFRPGQVSLVSHDGSTQSLPKRWSMSDEWYELAHPPARARILAIGRPIEAGPQFFVIGPGPRQKGASATSPVVWCRKSFRGRIWVTSLGHSLAGPSKAKLEALLAGAMRAAARGDLCGG